MPSEIGEGGERRDIVEEDLDDFRKRIKKEHPADFGENETTQVPEPRAEKVGVVGNSEPNPDTEPSNGKAREKDERWQGESRTRTFEHGKLDSENSDRAIGIEDELDQFRREIIERYANSTMGLATTEKDGAVQQDPRTEEKSTHGHAREGSERYEGARGFTDGQGRQGEEEPGNRTLKGHERQDRGNDAIESGKGETRPDDGRQDHLRGGNRSPSEISSKRTEVMDDTIGDTHEGLVGANTVVNNDRVNLGERGRKAPTTGGNDEQEKEGEKGREDSEHHRVVRKASTYMDSFALLVPERIIPEHDNRDDVFAVRVARESRPEDERVLYTTHRPDSDRAYLNIKQLDAEKDEEFRIKSVEKYGEKDFARSYNENKPKGLENTQISWEGKFRMKVDDLEFELKGWELRAQEGKAILDAKLNEDGKNAVKIARGIDDVDFRFTNDHAIVTSMREGREGIIATYQRTRNDIPHHRRLIEIPHLEGRELKEWRHEFKVEADGLEPERTLECKRDAVTVRISEKNRKGAAAYWASYESQGEKHWHQGDIGEEVAGCLLEKSGFRTVSEHTKPITNRIPVHKSENHGMERVVEKDGAYHVVQVKHWLDAQTGLNDAKEDIRLFMKSPERREVERTLGIKLKGGIAIEVHWSYQELEAVIYTDYLES